MEARQAECTQNVSGLPVGAVEVNEAVAVVDGKSEEVQERQAEEARDLCSEAAALFPHIERCHPQVFLAESGKLQYQVAGLVDISYLAVNPVDAGPTVTFDLADLSGHFVRNQGFCAPRIQDKVDLAGVVHAGWDQQHVNDSREVHFVLD